MMLSNVSLHRCLFTSGDVYSYHLTMTMMLSRMFRMCLFWGCLLLPPDTLVASVTMTKSGSSFPPQSNSDAILSQAKSVPQWLQLYIKHPQYEGLVPDWHNNGWIWGKRWHSKTRWVRTQESGQTKVEVKMSFGKKQSWFWEGCQHFYFAKLTLKFKRWSLRSSCLLAKT